MKKLLSVLLIVVTMLGLFSSTALATKYVVRTNEGRGMNVRSAKHNGEILGVIPDGTIVDVLEVDRYWGTIRYGGRIAYLYIDYIVPIEDTKLEKTTQYEVTTKPEKTTKTLKTVDPVKTTKHIQTTPKPKTEYVTIYATKTKVVVKQVNGVWTPIITYEPFSFKKEIIVQEQKQKPTLIPTQYKTKIRSK